MRGLAAGALATTACNALIGIPDVHRDACDADAPFLRMAQVGGLAGELGVQSAQLSRDELTVVFSRVTIAGPPDAPVSRYGDLYLAHRDRRDGDFGAPVALDELNTDLDELGGSLSDDQRTLYFDRREPAQRSRIFVASRASDGGRFDAPAALDLGDETASLVQPFATPGALLFAARRPDGSASLFLATGRGTSFATPRQLASIETLPAPAAYESPVASSTGLAIYFAAPPDNASPQDIWRASRASAEQPFGPPEPVTELNTISAERPAWLSDDRCRLYVTTNRAGRGFELWMASRAPP